MKKKKIYKIVFVLMIITLLTFIPLVKEKLIFSDSGFDTSYDSGGSSWSSSSWDNDDSWSSSSWNDDDNDYYSSSGSSREVTRLEMIFILSIFVFLLGMAIIPNLISEIKSKKNSKETKEKLENIVIKKIREYIPDFDKEQFIQEGYKIYLDVQNAWMNFDLDKVKSIVSNELLAQYESQLATLEVKGEQNIMEDFKMEYAVLQNVLVENDTIDLTVVYCIKFKDYIINQSTKEVLRGNKNKINTVTYEMHFRKELKGVDNHIKCPNCGAEVDIVTSATCPYCHTKIVRDSGNWVLTQKRNKYQR